MSPEQARLQRARIEKLARLLDDAIPIPGTPWRIGADALIGLVPVAGDVAGLALGGYLIYEGVRLRAPRGTLGRMVAYTLLDAVGGFVPVIGDLFDFAFKCHRRNAQLLIAHLAAIEGRPPERRSWTWAWALGIAVVAGLGLYALLRRAT